MKVFRHLHNFSPTTYAFYHVQIFVKSDIKIRFRMRRFGPSALDKSVPIYCALKNN